MPLSTSLPGGYPASSTESVSGDESSDSWSTASENNWEWFETHEVEPQAEGFRRMTVADSMVWEFRTPSVRMDPEAITHCILFALDWDPRVSHPPTTVVMEYGSTEEYGIARLSMLQRLAKEMGWGDDRLPDDFYVQCDEAIQVMEQAVNQFPSNIILITKLLEVYRIRGDIDQEIIGWWKLFEQHPPEQGCYEI